MGSNPVGDSDFFCPTLVVCRSINLTHFITELKIHHRFGHFGGSFSLVENAFATRQLALLATGIVFKVVLNIDI